MHYEIELTVKKLLAQVEKTTVQPTSLNDALRRLENAKTESAVAEIKEVPIQPLEPSVVSEAAKLTDGMIVLVHDLKNAAELNGQLGTVKGFMQESGR